MPIVRWPYKAKQFLRGQSITDALNAIFMEIANTFRFGPFLTREAFVDRFDNGDGRFFPDVGTIVKAGLVEYVYDGTSTEILDLPGWRPHGVYTPLHFGSTGTKKSRTDDQVYGWTLADKYETLAEAQAVFPKATALTQTIDDHATQRMIDALRETITYGTGNIGETRVAKRQIKCHWPGGEYVYTRSVDITDIRSPANMIEFTSDRALIYSQCVGETTFDLLNTQGTIWRGFTVIPELIRGVGCPRSVWLFGRGASGASSGQHRWDDIEVDGFCTLAPWHTYASETNEYRNIHCVNRLDNRMWICDLDDLDEGGGTLTTGEAVTWSGGSGTVFQKTTSTIIVFTEDSLSDGTAVTAASGATFSTGSPYQEPDGEGPGTSVFAFVYDTDNKFGTDSQYTDNRGEVIGSCLENHFEVGTYINSGRGHVFYFGGGARHVDMVDVYMAQTGDDDGRAGVYLNCNTNTLFRDFYMPNHVESDGGDSGAGASLTGVDYAVLVDSETAGRTATLYNFRQRATTMNPAVACYAATANVSEVKLQDFDFHVAELGLADDPDNRVMWGDPEKFTVDGRVACCSETRPEFLNIADLAGFAGWVRIDDITTESLRRADTSVGFMISDSNQTAFMNRAVVVASTSGGSTGVLGKDVDNTTTGELRIYPNSLRLHIGASEILRVTPSSYYPISNGSVSLGLTTNRYLTAYASNFDYASQVRYQGTKVLGAQGGAVNSVSVTYTSGSAPSANSAVTIANSASPTVTELLEYIAEVHNELETLKSRLEVHGLIASS